MSATKGTRKSTAKKSSSSKSKSRKRKSTFEKGKVYIPRYKTIFFCVCVIVVCITLLLITSIKNDKNLSSSRKEKQKTEQIAKTEQKKTESKKSVEKKTEDTAKDSTKANSIIANSTTTKTSKDSKTSGKTEPKKADVKKTPEPVKETGPVQPVKIEAPKSTETVKTPVEKADVKTDSAEKKAPNSQGTQTQTQQQQQKPVYVDKFDFPQAVNKAELVFVFDDGGQNLSHINRFLKLPFPITVAVLPKIAHSAETAKKVRQSGNEVILHQPMQSVNPKVNPGPGAITPDMTEDQIISTLFQNITEIGPISGVNNHEGSGITADAEKMAVVMKTVSEEGLYFLDSRTNVETKVPYVAQEMGYHYYERNIFLDNEKTRENALNELKKGLNIANKNGVVIMIGHVWSADFLPAFLEEAYPELVRKGYTFKTVSNSKARK